MTRKDYIALAEFMRQTRPEPEHFNSYRQWERMLNALCIVLKGDNSRFNVDRFNDVVFKETVR